MMTTQFEGLTLESLELQEREISEQRTALGKLHKALRAELDRRYAVIRAQEKLAQMSLAEREALLHVIQAQSIQSTEEFGQIGG